MNIYAFEFKSKIGSFITWSIACVAIIFLFMSLFPAFAADTELMSEMLAQMPKELLIAFGMENMDFGSVLGFYGIGFTFIQVCLAIQASNYGFSLVSVEESELTADFLLSKPVTRTQILTSKFLASLTALAITNAVIWVTSYIAIPSFSEGRAYSSDSLLLMLVSIIIFQLFFLTVGTIISLLTRRVRSVTAFSMALTFGMYFLNALGGLMGKETVEVISPFKHFDPNYMITNGAYNPLVYISVILIAGSVVGSYFLYTRRDIHSVT